MADLVTFKLELSDAQLLALREAVSTAPFSPGVAEELLGLLELAMDKAEPHAISFTAPPGLLAAALSQFVKPTGPLE